MPFLKIRAERSASQQADKVGTDFADSSLQYVADSNGRQVGVIWKPDLRLGSVPQYTSNEASQLSFPIC